MSETPVISTDDSLLVTGVTVRFAGVIALEDVSLELRRGEILGLIGPNGAGKTTLVNVLSGFQVPDAGAIVLDGEDVAGTPAHRFVRRGIGRTFQGGRVFATLTPLDHVELGALAAGVPRRQARKQSMQLLERVGIAASSARREAGALPFGAERRLGLARALAANPRFLFLDEPAAGLNEEESQGLADVIRTIAAEQNCGVLVIEHDMQLIMNLCGRIHVLDYGRTLAAGSPSEVRTNPAVLSAYLGSTP